jgi:flagellar biosynthesis chaperone FliJ
MWKKEKGAERSNKIWTASRLELEKGEEIVNRETTRRYLEECNRMERVSDPFSGNWSLGV